MPLLPAVRVPVRLRGAVALTERDGDPAVRSGPFDRTVDALAFLVSVLAGLALWGLDIEAAEAAGPPSERQDLQFGLDVLAGLLLCLTLWWRRRAPVVLAVLGALLTAVSLSAGPAGAVLLWTVVTRRRLTTSLALLPLWLASVLVFPLVQPDPATPYALEALLGVFLTLVVFLGALWVRARRGLAASQAERARLVEADRDRQVAQARQLERARIAREMHDVLAHRLSLVSMHAGALEYRPDAPPEELARAAGVVRASAHQALQDLREVVGVLREDPGEQDDDRVRPPQPTLADLPALVEESRAAGLRVHADHGGLDLGAVPDAVGRTAYRIVQEGLTNVRKHAGGGAAELTVRGRPGGELCVELRNPLPVGTLGPAVPGSGTGLVGVAERAALAGGRVAYGQAGGRFVLSATLPWT